MRTNLRNLKTFGALTAGVMTLTLALALSLAPPAEGKPPGGGGNGGGGGGEPVPPGTLYYLVPNGIDGVLADGSGGEAAFPFNDAPNPEPSSLIYHNSGTDYRLWLRSEPSKDSEGYYLVYFYNGNPVSHQDLFVYRDIQGSQAIESFQLTNFFGSFIVGSEVRWSNDGEDSFISFEGIDIRGAYDVDAQGNLHLDGTGIRGIFRIPISGLAIDGEQLIDPQVVQTVVTGGNGAEGNFEHGWSADGTKVAYLLSDGQSYDVWVKDLEAGTDLNKHDGSPFTRNPRFSPFDNLVSVNDAGGAKIINAATGDFVVTVPTATGPYWSLDGNQLSFVETTQKGFKVTRYLSRISLSSGAVTRVKELQGNTILPWVSNNNSPPPAP